MQVASRDDVANAAAIFTRGAMDAPDLRGDSMVTKHLEKLQQEKEKRSFAMIQALHDDVGPMICAVVLEETQWDVDSASALLKRFKAENQDKLRKLSQVSLASCLRHAAASLYAHLTLSICISGCDSL